MRRWPSCLFNTLRKFRWRSFWNKVYSAMFLAQTSRTDYEELCLLDVLGLEIFNCATMTFHKWHSNKRELEDTVIDNEEKTFTKQQLGHRVKEMQVLSG